MCNFRWMLRNMRQTWRVVELMAWPCPIHELQITQGEEQKKNGLF